ncbi:efflux RND transporter periplasmic adaptor subunit [Cereibacter sphaeroides]|uniref:efflux RND transporter periplasmic adaptor subunit n=1 Tax=Cereibacter sphaeroides TaxID=1063 RepID=UPI001F1F8607|nr:efflux RND transporter periplasmic adaptor subunit [Cereibacter sphaeroides]MCE6961318.1 efflux RND transporter periplasmic adaptor subunit [Cereibacter sphaeroides]MCE6970304.1 efflux RND transporter periplasmic adaptor subunit [Cereibacter sphaeroides]MCE6972068.1 efflux RND transporter periplasmic adaptor subunit [Cereibacter sphaeroides]
MSLLKQSLLVLAVAAALLVIWVLYVPAARPLLARVGLLEPMARIGIVAEDAEAEAAPGPQRGGPGGPVRVLASAPAERLLNAVVTAVGTARAVRSVTVSPEVEGRVAAIGAVSGGRVAAGAVLVELDSEAARIAVDRANLVLADTREDLERVRRLSGSGATTDIARQEAELAEKTAELELQQARFELSQHRILAPFDGWVGIIEIEVGDRVNRGDAITRIDDRSSLLVDFRVPERVVGQIGLSDAITATALSGSQEPLEGTISALDNRVDEASRTLRVQATIRNADDRLRAGMAFSIRLALPGEPRPAVDPLAIQWGSEGAYVWVVRGGKAERVAIQILQRDEEAVLIQAALRPDDLVVTEGVQSLRPGATVEVLDPSGLAAGPAGSRS